MVVRYGWLRCRCYYSAFDYGCCPVEPVAGVDVTRCMRLRTVDVVTTILTLLGCYVCWLPHYGDFGLFPIAVTVVTLIPQLRCYFRCHRLRLDVAVVVIYVAGLVAPHVAGLTTLVGYPLT